ncbi:Zn-ribbon domain-containing OB-fold protein [Pseudonocardia dioxanivorans]|uniref:Zn-ribbon domain-containing OB-fold protein n=1 Tax=Pseudonocardia dioxanivorans TaxID=240495 RepID=UPI000CD046F1|nr:Zn-ribbon domain-containing OB-fold protein [Pseudonocardia dioxanivorans]
MLSHYIAGLAAGELRITRCTVCGTTQFPPRRVCPQCSTADSAEWITAGGAGTVWSYCVFHKAYMPAPAPQPPYTVAVVELDEGTRLITNIVETAEVRIGMPVRAVFGSEDGEPRVRFRPTDQLKVRT